VRCIEQGGGGRILVNPLLAVPDEPASADHGASAGDGRLPEAPIVRALHNSEVSMAGYSFKSEQVATFWLMKELPNKTITWEDAAETSSNGDLMVMVPREKASAHVAGGPSEKAKAVCGTLRAALPNYDKVMSTFFQHGAWWDSFHQKINVISQSDSEIDMKSLPAFCQQKYTSNNPAELGILVTAYARSVMDRVDLYDLVDRLIVSDFAHAASTEGMECLVLLAKSYTDIGQPRRAWFTWRRGMAIAQIMVRLLTVTGTTSSARRSNFPIVDQGFYRVNKAAPTQQLLWWALYHGDRFTSMLLGLPHGFHDGFFSQGDGKGAQNPEHEFVHQCAVMGGKIIERNISTSTPSFAQAMALQERWKSLSKLLSGAWWDLPHGLPHSGHELSNLRDRLLQQYYYFHVGMYIHVPFLAVPRDGTPPDPLQEVSRSLGREAARQMLRRYALLRAEVNGASVFDCKTSDFVAFTAALVLQSGPASQAEGMDQAKRSKDRDLIASTTRIFYRLETADGCRIASQCRRVMELFSGHNIGEGQTRAIRIPYFGTIVRRSPTETLPPVDQVGGGSWQSQKEMPRDTLNEGMPAISSNYLPSGWSIVDFIDSPSSGSAEGSLMDEFFMGDPSLWQNEALFDIDQDWLLID